MKLILASASPRRKELLEQIGLEFEVRTSGAEEFTTASQPGQIGQELSEISGKTPWQTKRKNPGRTPGSSGTDGTAQKETGRTAGETESGSRSEVETLERGTSQRLIFAHIPFADP